MSTKDRILNAAEALACEVGTASLTLDAVAERARLSKGGLLYHFGGKDALLEAMLARRLELFEQVQSAIGGRQADPGSGKLRAFLQAGLDDLTESAQFCRAMLAAVFSNPALLKPVRAFLKRKLKEMDEAAVGRDQAILLWLAVEGLRFHEMFEVSPLTPAERRRIVGLVLEYSERKF